MSVRFSIAIAFATTLGTAGLSLAQNPPATLSQTNGDEISKLVDAKMFSPIVACMIRAGEEAYRVKVSYVQHQRPVEASVIDYPNVEIFGEDYVPYTVLKGRNAAAQIEITARSDVPQNKANMYSMTITVTSLATLQHPGYRQTLHDEYIRVMLVDLSKANALPFMKGRPGGLDALTTIHYNKIDFAAGQQDMIGMTVLANGVEVQGYQGKGVFGGVAAPAELHRPATREFKKLDETARGCVVGN